MQELFPSSEQMRHADNYAQWTFGLFERFITGAVLEVGCGVGTFTRLIAGHAACESLHSIDISPPAVACVKAQGLPAKVAVECRDLIEVEGHYDLVVCMNVMEHVEDDIAFLEKLFALLGENGVLFLLVPAHEWMYCSFDKAGGHFRRYSRRSLNRHRIPEAVARIEQYYFNMIGAIGFWAVYGLLRKEPAKDPKYEIGFFDKVIVPLSRRLLPTRVPFGISLVSVYRKA